VAEDSEMAAKKAEIVKKDSDTGVIVAAAVVGIGLVVYGVTMMSGSKGTTVLAQFTVQHLGPPENLKVRLSFGDKAFGDLYPNPDLVNTVPWDVDLSTAWESVSGEVEVLVPPKKKLGWPLPFTYDAKLEILDAVGNEYPEGGEGLTWVVQENVFTHTEDFEVIMH